jgi:hypothetical protein
MMGTVFAQSCCSLLPFPEMLIDIDSRCDLDGLVIFQSHLGIISLRGPAIASRH